MGKYIKKLVGIDVAKSTDLYSPTLIKVIDGSNSRLLLKKIGPTNTELVVTGDTLATLEIIKKVTNGIFDSSKYGEAIFG